ncbi:MAG: S41 family peptidase [Planctomycetota bacterium]
MSAVKVKAKPTPVKSLLFFPQYTRSAIKLFAWAVSAMLLLGSLGQAQETTRPAEAQPTPAETEGLPFDQAAYLAAFEQVWQTIRDTHWDAKLVESVWVPAREKYLPRIQQAQTRDEAVQILSELLLELKQSHFEIIPAETYLATEEAEAKGGDGWSGLTLRSVDDQLVVTKLATGSPAAKAGVEVGWALQQVQPSDEEEPLTMTEFRELADKLCKVRGYRPEFARGLLSEIVTTGEIGKEMKLVFLDNQDKERSVSLILEKGLGQPTKLGHLPLTYVNFEYRKLPEHVGYIQFNAFLDAPRLIKEYQAALLDEHNSAGVVIDVRGNMGGLIFLAMGMSGWFVDEPHSLGSMQSKTNRLKLAINPRKPKFDKPVAILVDECSASCAELFPGGLQELKAARIFGSRTAGQVIPAQVVKLPTGDGFLYAVSALESESGFVWEGYGVQPDVPVALTRKLLQQDPDPTLTAALKWIASQSNK